MSLGFPKYVDIAANQHPVLILYIPIGSPNTYETEHKTLILYYTKHDAFNWNPKPMAAL